MHLGPRYRRRILIAPGGAGSLLVSIWQAALVFDYDFMKSRLLRQALQYTPAFVLIQALSVSGVFGF